MFGLIKPVAMVTVKYLGHTALILTSQTDLVESMEPVSGCGRCLGGFIFGDGEPRL